MISMPDAMGAALFELLWCLILSCFLQTERAPARVCAQPGVR
jgi:hypothetical protein